MALLLWLLAYIFCLHLLILGAKQSQLSWASLSIGIFLEEDECFVQQIDHLHLHFHFRIYSYNSWIGIYGIRHTHMINMIKVIKVSTPRKLGMVYITYSFPLQLSDP